VTTAQHAKVTVTTAQHAKVTVTTAQHAKVTVTTAQHARAASNHSYSVECYEKFASVYGNSRRSYKYH